MKTFFNNNFPELLLIVGFAVSTAGIYFEFGRNVALMLDGALLMSFSIYLARG